MPLISMGAADDAALLSLVSMATMAAPVESPTKRMPFGPNASGPADLSGALPVVRPVMPALNARAAVRQSAATSCNGVEEVTLRMFAPVRMGFNFHSCIAITGRRQCAARIGSFRLFHVPLTNHRPVGHLRADEGADRLAVGHRADFHRGLCARGERRWADSFTSQLIRAAPFNAPLHHFSVGVSHNDLDPRMGVHELKLFDGTRDLLN